MSRSGGLAAAFACCAALLGACSPSTPAPPISAPSTSVTVVVPSDLTPAPTGVPQQHDDGSTGGPNPGSTLVLDDAARASALDRGQKVMTLFARRDVSAQQWQVDLIPYLTPQAVQAYSHVDPKSVPPTKITGGVKLTPASVPLVARVSVPTDAGIYLVILSRSDERPVWLADRILPPEGSGDF